MLAVQQQGVDDGSFASSLAELRRLAITLGLDVVGKVTQRRAKVAPGKVVGDGKLVELSRWTGGTGEIEAYKKPGTTKMQDKAAIDARLKAEAEADAEPETDQDDDAAAEAPVAEAPVSSEDDVPSGGPPPGVTCSVVLVDHDLTPSQQRNLEAATGAEVMDRTQVILGIFHRHAHTREARLQVEIARLQYLAPRLRELGGGTERQRGGGVGRSAGETSLELDRRKIRDRIAELRDELAAIEGGGKIRRARRGDVSTVAVVGYTNAGKSSLMRALTGSDVYIADKLFATLDTTVRVLDARVKPPILLSDTVGFIKKLPHDLVASFRSTLEEAAAADLLLHVVDASDAAFRDHMDVTRSVLAEVGADAPMMYVLNKSDRLTDEQRAELALAFPDAVIMSAKNQADVVALREQIVERFAGASVTVDLLVPWDRHKLVHSLHDRCHVLGERHDEAGTLVTVRGPKSILDELSAELAAPAAPPS